MPAECAVCEWHPYPTCEMGALRTVGDRGATRNGKSRLQRDHRRVDGPLERAGRVFRNDQAVVIE